MREKGAQCFTTYVQFLKENKSRIIERDRISKMKKKNNMDTVDRVECQKGEKGTQVYYYSKLLHFDSK